jgi:hypothetical protein
MGYEMAKQEKIASSEYTKEHGHVKAKSVKAESDSRPHL